LTELRFYVPLDKIGHFRDVLPTNLLAYYLKTKYITTKANNTTKQSKLKQKNTQNAKPKQIHKN